MNLFDFELHRPSGKVVIDYGVIRGSPLVLLIKAGQNGSACGYEDKYLKIAVRVHKEYGATVVCASNPFDGTNPLDDAFEVIKDTLGNDFAACTVYFMGMSKGGSVGAWFGADYAQIKRMLLINAPLMINSTRTIRSAERFCGESLAFVYGDDDPSAHFVEMLKVIRNDKVRVKIISGQDHYFSRDHFDLMDLLEREMLK